MSGRHTGTSDIPLTAFGERQVSSTGRMLVGPGKFLDPKQVRKVWVSPRQRATRTFRLLFSDVEKHSDARERSEQSSTVAGIHEGILAQGNGSIEISEDIREWDYDEYEGMKASEVIDLRKKRCLEQDGLRWSVWRDGCEGGEYARSRSS